MSEELLHGWPIDKNLDDFAYIAKGLEMDGLYSRAYAVEYLIARLKLAEEKIETLKKTVDLYKKS